MRANTSDSTTRPAGVGALSLSRWTALCAAAEAIGMTAAATAARLSQSVVGDEPTGARRVAGLALVVAGGLVEGVALGGFQASGMARLVPRLDRRRWLVVTTAVAGVGWAAGAAPAALSASSDDAGPPLLPVLAGAVGLGLAMGALLGAAQASGLRGLVSHPRRWIGASAAGWAPAMAIVFVGASAPGTGWHLPAVAALGTATGLVAGAVLGLVTGAFLPALGDSGPSRAAAPRSRPPSGERPVP